jgi:hypothetical protein
MADACCSPEDTVVNDTAPADSPNPYASPAAESSPVSLAEGEIAVVVRVFRWLGRLGTVVFGLGVCVWSVELASVFIPPVRMGDERVPAVVLFVRWMVSGAILAFSIGLLRVAARMARHRPDARRKALVLSSLMLIGFPLFTLIGFLCIQKVNRHYEAYCQEYLASAPD